MSCWDWLCPKGCRANRQTVSDHKHMRFFILSNVGVLISHKHVKKGTLLAYYRSVFISGSLSACYSYLAAIQTLVENDSHRPHIHLVGDFRWLLSNHKALRGQVPKVEKTAKHFLVYDIIFPTSPSPFPDYWTLLYSSPRTSSSEPVQNIFLKYQCTIIIKFFTAKPFTQPRPINSSLLSPLAEMAFTQQNNDLCF